MVVVFVNVPPDARRGSVHNAGVRLSTHAEGNSLRSGWLMRTELLRSAALKARSAKVSTLPREGPIVTEAQVTGSKERDAQITGFVVGGARLFKDRPVGIGFNEEFIDAVTQAAVLPASMNDHRFRWSEKKVVSQRQRNDQYIELEVPQRYQKDPFHFVNVVLNLGFAESSAKRTERMEFCRSSCWKPNTDRSAAWQLEAIGKDGIPALWTRRSTPIPKCVFYAAHSLAYLGDPRSHRGPQATRATASSLPRDVLHGAIDDRSSRCGRRARRAAARRRSRNTLRRTARPPQSRCEQSNGHRCSDRKALFDPPNPSNAAPLVAISLENKPEIVIFGPTPRLTLPVPFKSIRGSC